MIPLTSPRRRSKTSPKSGSRDQFEMLVDEESTRSEFYDTQPLINASDSETECERRMYNWCGGVKRLMPRSIVFSGGRAAVKPSIKYPNNVVRNQKYSLLTFIPRVLYEQFRFFFNLYFLVVALTQLIPKLKVGFMFTYVAPLVFVVSVTMIKEAYDDFLRYCRDKEANSQLYQALKFRKRNGFELISPEYTPSSSLKVGDIVLLHSGERVPADLILLRTKDDSGSVFIKTDQLDGETDWKLRKSIPTFQNLSDESLIAEVEGIVNVEAPQKAIYDFAGNFRRGLGDVEEDESIYDPLGLENTLWANTVIATGSIWGLVIYTGNETRSVMNANIPSSKIGLTDLELNNLSKVLFGVTIALAVFLILLKGINGPWLLYMFRFILLFSAIIPISLRVNLDMAKTLYSYLMMRDSKMPGTIARSSTIPEELGRLSYLFTDKTGTLTQNVMEFKKLQLQPPFLFERENLHQIIDLLKYAYVQEKEAKHHYAGFKKSEASTRLLQAIRAMAVCHNVTPVVDDSSGEKVYQAASPDEIALVKFCESVHVILEARDENEIVLRTPLGDCEMYKILRVFPFTSESKRMGIIVQSVDTGDIIFFVKGAESVLKTMVEHTDWLDEEIEGLAREGLRTLVFGMKQISKEEYNSFNEQYLRASSQLNNRQQQIREVIETLEENLLLVGLSGVEDKLQEGVQTCLENLRNAGIKIWMLTGDKDETAKCIARSAKLVDNSQEIFSITVKTKQEAARRLDLFGSRLGAALVIDGTSLQLCLDNFETFFIELACESSAVICCRCSPTQKAEVVELMKNYTQKRCAAVGDGGNDVSMIQAAHVGIGIVGKEGKQASLAADYSVDQFMNIQRLILWHGRNSYKQSARLAQFIMHRGTIISVIQAVFSAMFFYAAIPIYTGWLIVGYATIFTFLPVFCLVLDRDIDEKLVYVYPELYTELQKGRPLSYKTFFIWILQSVYQGGAIMVMAIHLFQHDFINVVSITFTALIFSELLNVALEIQHWHWMMVAAEVLSLFFYVMSMFILRSSFDISYILSADFLWKTIIVTLVSTIPVSIGKYMQRVCAPTTASKVH